MRFFSIISITKFLMIIQASTVLAVATDGATTTATTTSIAGGMIRGSVAGTGNNGGGIGQDEHYLSNRKLEDPGTDNGPWGACKDELGCESGMTASECNMCGGIYLGDHTMCDDKGSCHIKTNNNGRWNNCKQVTRGECIKMDGTFAMGGKC